MNDQIENYELDMNNIPAHIAFIMMAMDAGLKRE